MKIFHYESKLFILPGTFKYKKRRDYSAEKRIQPQKGWIMWNAGDFQFAGKSYGEINSN